MYQLQSGPRGLESCPLTTTGEGALQVPHRSRLDRDPLRFEEETFVLESLRQCEPSRHEDDFDRHDPR